jgi:hypothetical protein
MLFTESKDFQEPQKTVGSGWPPAHRSAKSVALKTTKSIESVVLGGIAMIAFFGPEKRGKTAW